MHSLYLDYKTFVEDEINTFVHDFEGKIADDQLLSAIGLNLGTINSCILVSKNAIDDKPESIERTGNQPLIFEQFSVRLTVTNICERIQNQLQSFQEKDDKREARKIVRAIEESQQQQHYINLEISKRKAIEEEFNEKLKLQDQITDDTDK